MKKRLTLIQMDVHVNDVEYNYNRVQELLVQSLSESPDSILGSPGLGYIREWMIQNHRIVASIE